MDSRFEVPGLLMCTNWAPIPVCDAGRQNLHYSYCVLQWISYWTILVTASAAKRCAPHSCKYHAIVDFGDGPEACTNRVLIPYGLPVCARRHLAKLVRPRRIENSPFPSGRVASLLTQSRPNLLRNSLRCSAKCLTGIYII